MGKYYSYVLICFLILIASLIVYFCSFWLWEAIEKLGEKITTGKFAFVGDFLGNGLFFFFALFLFSVSVIYDDHIAKVCGENIVTAFSFLMFFGNAVAEKKNIFKITFVMMLCLSTFISSFAYIILLDELHNSVNSSLELSLSIVVQTIVLYANIHFFLQLSKRIFNMLFPKVKQIITNSLTEDHSGTAKRIRKHIKSVFDEVIAAVPLITLILQLLGIID